MFEIKNFKKWHWIVLVLIILVVVGIVFCSQFRMLFQAKGYQAVFLSNGQVYFGKISSLGDKWITMKDIYYLQVTQPLQQTGTDAAKTPAPAQQSSNIQLIKLGSELHGPQDMMYIERDKILFWENMKDDSKVVDAIKKYKVGQ